MTTTTINPRAVRTISQLPGDIAPIPVLVVSSRAGLLVEAWAVDRREGATDTLWLQLYDLGSADDLDPEESLPLVPALPLRADAAEGLAVFNFADCPLHYTTGLLLVVSSLPDSYEEIDPGVTVALCARVLP